MYVKIQNWYNQINGKELVSELVNWVKKMNYFFSASWIAKNTMGAHSIFSRNGQIRGLGMKDPPVNIMHK